MEILDDKKKCCGCYACYNACPVHAIDMQENEEGFIYPVIDDSRCIHCGKCKMSCPILSAKAECEIEEAYACYAKDMDERMNSSSGGVFAVLAKTILAENGIVCGAVFDTDMSVKHICIEHESELKKLKGTKYVQSRIEDNYSQIKQFLKSGRSVLFSGTPCQVTGLKSYLREEKNNLYCVDLICHGVPSPGVWKDYLKDIGNGQKVINANFRQKEEGTEKTYLKYYLDNGEEVLEPKESSLYMKGFIQNLFLRESCFDCKFKGKTRCSDITIGDFWSIHEFHSAFANEAGNSAVIVRTGKGQKLFEKAIEFLKVEKATVKEVAYWNECLEQSTAYNEERTLFYKDWKNIPLFELIEGLTKIEKAQQNDKSNRFFRRVKNKIKRILYE